MSIVRQRYARRRRQPAMGSWPSWFQPPSWFQDAVDSARAHDVAEQVRCVNQANMDSRVLAIEAKQRELSSWSPLPTVSVTDLSIVTTAIKSAIAEARNAVSTAPRSTGDAEAQIRGQVTDLDGPWASGRVAAWEKAISEARATGASVIDVPDLKSSVIKSLNHVSNAFMMAAYFECRVSWLDRAAEVVGRIVAIAKQVVGTVLEVGQAVVKAALAPLNIIGWLGRYPYIPIGIAAIILFKRYGVRV